MATPDDDNHAAIPMRSATTDSRNAKNYAHRNNHSLQNTKEEPITLGTTPAAPAAHRRYLSSLAATTLHGKTHGFVLRLPSLITTSLRHRFPSSPLPFLTTSLRYKPCHSLFLFCDVLNVMYSFTPPFECIAMWCIVSHHPSLSVLLCDVLLCDVKSHTTLHWVYCYVM